MPEVAYKILVSTEGKPYSVVDKNDNPVMKDALRNGTGGEVVGVEVVEILAIRDPKTKKVHYCPHVACDLYCRMQGLATKNPD
jgi:hypothetical protein